MLPDPLPLINRLHPVLASDQAVEQLRWYFGIGQPPGAASFTGRRFEHLAGGGDRPEAANAVTADDLIAVQTLSVTIPAEAALDLLEGRLGAQLSDLLYEIPNRVDMAEADAADLAPGSPTDAAWRLLTDQPGIGWVTAGKLLARKRPRFLPVYDPLRPWPARIILARPACRAPRRRPGLASRAGGTATVCEDPCRRRSAPAYRCLNLAHQRRTVS
ncbi:DUF6308 family protein [Streptomyces scabiei]|uniref:DUF6308 family protein n=1 Tax=Streptomyces scabiei TaxID=1930 RepID=UPI00299FE539|nr:DUF6308 family protein [Streptomyces scabiei]MDX3282386.1 DUF6308 family protein [Streptomyces scabiei]